MVPFGSVIYMLTQGYKKEKEGRIKLVVHKLKYDC